MITNAEDEEAKASETEYYQIQGAFEGTQKQTGFPVELSLTMLKMQALANDRFKCTVLHGLTKSVFYHYQASGALYMYYKAYGHLPVSVDHAAETAVHLAIVAMPKPLQTFGGFNKDMTGLGKTKQVLPVLLLRAKLCLQDAPRPALILVPATLILQWAKEIHESWPGLTLWICYSMVELPSVYKSNTITASHLKGLPRLDHLPEHLRFLFDESNRSEIKRSSVILSSYETWGDSSVDTVVLTGTDKNGEDFQQIDNLCGRCFTIRIAPNTAADA